MHGIYGGPSGSLGGVVAGEIGVTSGEVFGFCRAIRVFTQIEIQLNIKR